MLFSNLYSYLLLSQLFLIKRNSYINYFNKPNCQYLENWAKANIKTTSINEYERYTFLNYDEELTPKNANLNKEYDAIIGEYRICEMFNDDYKCFTCNDDK